MNTSMLSKTGKPLDRSRAMRVLGISIDNLVKKFLGKGAEALTKDEYVIFWTQIQQTEKAACEVLRALVNELVNVTEAKKPQTCYSLQSLINTINFTQFRFHIKADRPLRGIVGRWEEVVSKKQTKKKKKKEEEEEDLEHGPIARSSEVVRLIQKRVVDKQSALTTLLIRASNLHEIEEFKQLGDALIATIEDIQGPDLTQLRGEYATVYAHLKEFAGSSPSNLKTFFDTVLLQVQTLPQQLKINAKLAKTSLLALLHMFRQFSSYWRIPDPEILLRAEKILHPFFIWPEPYGSATRQVLLLCKKEVIAPGNELLRRFAAESTVAEVNGPEGRSRPCYYICDKESLEAGVAASVMNLGFADEKGDDIFQDSEGLSAEATALLLLNLLHHDVGITDTDMQYFRSLSVEDVSILFDEAIAILHEVLAEANEDSQQTRFNRFQQLKQNMHARALATYNLNKEIYEGKRPHEDIPMIQLPDPLPPDYLPTLPPIAHLLMACSVSSMPQNGINIKDFGTLINSQVYLKLARLLESLSFLSDIENPAHVRLCIAGGDKVLHGIVTAYVTLTMTRPDLLSGMDLQFFLIPFSHNHLASFLARHDSWYNRHIFIPFRSKQYVLPDCVEGKDYLYNAGGGQTFTDEVLPPGKFLRESVENYLREATHSVPIKLWKVEGWMSSDAKRGGAGWKTGSSDQVIPFCLRVDIGINVYATQFKDRMNLETVSEAKDHKNFAWNPTELTIMLEPVDLDGQPVEQLVDRNATYRSIAIQNVPEFNDESFPADPSIGWLELTAHVAEVKRKKLHVLMNESNQHVRRVWIECCNSADQIPLLVDGSLFGPFSKIAISPVFAETEDGKDHMELPLRTFFPLDI